MGLILGSYLKKPVTEKESTDEANDKLKTGASSMQGWRVTQEDAHNCLLDYDVNTSLFAVYDGHGGHEVAVYCSQNLPDYIKNTEAYKAQNYEKALIDAFLGFDATIASDEVISKLQKIATDRDDENESSSSDIEENVKNLYEEATMPLERVIEKYTSNLKNTILHNLQKENERQAAALQEDNDAATTEACSSSGEGSSSKSYAAEDAVSSSTNTESSTKPKDIENGAIEKPEIKIDLVDSPTITAKDDQAVSSAKPEANENKTKTKQSNQNGEIQSPLKEEEKAVNAPVENGEISKKGKGKATAKTKGVPKSPTRKTRPKRNAQQLYNKLLELESESDSEDEEDQTFQEPNEDSSSDEENPNAAVDSENSDATSDEEEEDEEEDDEDDEDDLENDLDAIGMNAARHLQEKPGSNSGCTAVVALLHENQLFVANAGDSRCIVSRNGKAIEMSFDHKPSDDPEYKRIKKAGGKVSSDGRVDGGLNLSRAIGDHAYKQNKELSDREQMITALPDIQSLTINPNEDEFMVLACDGIWNSMSSQEVVDFVRPKIQESPERLSQICEEMFDSCLSPGTLGNGDGCDNMTAIIVQFKQNLCKRASDDEVECGKLKRPKIDESASSTETAA